MNVVQQTRRSDRPRVAIVGAGLGGLTAAIALLRRGFPVSVYEQAPALRELGAGLTLPPTAMRVFDALGLWPEIQAVSTHGSTLAFVHYHTGALLHGAHDPIWSRPPESPEQSGHAHRSAVHAVLVKAVQALDPEAIRLGHRLEELEQDAGAVRARFDNGLSAETDLLIGADGIQSAVYRALFDDGPTATFTGVMAIRCLMPRTPKIEPFLTGGRAVNYVGPGRGFHRYGIENGTVLNCVALCTTDRWTQQGWTHPCSRDEFLDLYRDFHPDVKGLIAHAPAEQIFKWGLRARQPIPQWSSGRVVLLGDAAHAMLPYLGQGATAAIEDAFVLARALDEHDDLAAAFSAYEAERIPRTLEQMRMSQKQGEALNRGPEAYAKERPDQAALSRYDPRLGPSPSASARS